MELIAIKETQEENNEFLNYESCAEIVNMSVEFCRHRRRPRRWTGMGMGMATTGAYQQIIFVT